MHKSSFNIRSKDIEEEIGHDDVPPGQRLKGSKRGALTQEEKLEIVYQVVIKLRKYSDVAKEFRVKEYTVSLYVTEARKNPRFIRDLFSKRKLKQKKKDLVKQAVEDMSSKNDFIDSCRSVVKHVNGVNDDAGHPGRGSLTEPETLKIMKELGLKYKKVQHIALSANSQRGLVLRQQWAINYLKQDPEYKVTCFLDETWLGMSDFRRQKWQMPGSKNSVGAFQMTPRVTMMTALDSLGNCYVALAQSNSNESMMSLFWKSLVKKLDKERPNWRKTTIWVFDGAAYHSSEASLKLLKQLKVPIMMTGPHR